MGSVETIPDPVFRSIIPLKRYNRGSYKVTSYDDSGKSIIYCDTIRSNISEPYAYYNDSLIYYDEYYENYYYPGDTTKIVFPFGWIVSMEDYYPSSGTLLWHREATDSTPASLQIHGVFSRDTMLFWKDTSYTWLQYPAQTGTQWDLHLPGSEHVSQFEIIGTEEPKFLISAAPHACYVYKEKKDETVSYHYYHPGWGLIASLDYKNGKRVRAIHIIPELSYIYSN